MLKSTERIIESPLQNHLIRDEDLACLFKSTPASRYALVNKALKKGELIRLCRGVYTLPAKYLSHPFSQYYLANRILPNSFITAESALSFHGWIPERVTQITSIVAFGRNRQFDTPMGLFVYRTAPIAMEHFYYGVNLIEINQQVIYMATPLRALMDYIYWHKIKNANRHFLQQSLRIEEENIAGITKKEVQQLMPVYGKKAIQQFLLEIKNG